MIKQYVAQEFCLRCQGCCRFPEPDTVWSPGLLESDKKRLLKNDLPCSLVTAGNKIRLVRHEKQDNFICSFLNVTGNICKVYAFRPFECQLYPFLINRRKGKVLLSVDLKCPFIAQDLKSARFKKYAEYLAGLLNKPRLLNILKNNPQVIQEYSDAADLGEIKL